MGGSATAGWARPHPPGPVASSGPRTEDRLELVEQRVVDLLLVRREDAEEQVVRSRFDSRVAATIASRDNAYADLYLDTFRDQARSRQAFSDAARYEELAGAALDRLNAAARSFGRTADENWDSRLALPASFGEPVKTDELYRRASDTLNQGFFVNVEVD